MFIFSPDGARVVSGGDEGAKPAGVGRQVRKRRSTRGRFERRPPELLCGPRPTYAVRAGVRGSDCHPPTLSRPACAPPAYDPGEAKRNASLNSADLAAYTLVASLMLNLDEAVTKE